MGVDVSFYVMFGFDLPYVDGEQVHKAFPKLTDEYGHSLKNPYGFVTLFDGMGGEYVRIGIKIYEATQMGDEDGVKTLTSEEFGEYVVKWCKVIFEHADEDSLEKLLEAVGTINNPDSKLMMFAHFS